MPDLFDIELEEVSSVDQGDCPEARVVFFKGRDSGQVLTPENPDGSINDAWIEVAVNKALEERPLSEETHTSTSTSERREHLEPGRTITTREITTLTTQRQVVEEIQREADRLMREDPELTPATARVKAWEERDDLAKAYRELAAEPARGRVDPGPESAPVTKGQTVTDRATARARELMKAEPGRYSSLAAARAAVYEQDEDLRDEFNRAMSS